MHLEASSIPALAGTSVQAHALPYRTVSPPCRGRPPPELGTPVDPTTTTGMRDCCCRSARRKWSVYKQCVGGAGSRWPRGPEDSLCVGRVQFNVAGRNYTSSSRGTAWKVCIECGCVQYPYIQTTWSTLVRTVCPQHPPAHTHTRQRWPAPFVDRFAAAHPLRPL